MTTEPPRQLEKGTWPNRWGKPGSCKISPQGFSTRWRTGYGKKVITKIKYYYFHDLYLTFPTLLLLVFFALFTAIFP